MTTRTIIIIRESIQESVVKDLFSVLSLSAAIGLGVYLESPPMQWVAGLIWLLAIINAAVKYTGDRTYKTVSEARAYLDSIAPELGEGSE